MGHKISKKLKSKSAGKAKKRIALVVSGALLALAAGLGLLLLHIDQSSSPAPDPDNAVVAVEDDFAKVNWKKWQNINSDVIGWVNIPGTNVNHPIVQANQDDPEYYLHHDAYKQSNPAGVPFVDARCDGLTGSMITPVYGHHFNGNRVFAQLAKMTDSAYAKKHAFAYLQTPEHKIKLEILSAKRINAANGGIETSFDDYNAFWSYIEDFGDGGGCDLGNPHSAFQAWALTTCSYTTWANERTVVFYRAVEVDGQDVAGKWADFGTAGATKETETEGTQETSEL